MRPIEPLNTKYGCRLIDLVRVKGKDEPLACYELFDELDKLTPEQQQLVDEFATGIEHWKAGDFEKALETFQGTEKLEAVQDEGEVNPSRMYQERCQQMIENPPEDWNGVWTCLLYTSDAADD